MAMRDFRHPCRCEVVCGYRAHSGNRVPALRRNYPG